MKLQYNKVLLQLCGMLKANCYRLNAFNDIPSTDGIMYTTAKKDLIYLYCGLCWVLILGGKV